MGLLIVCLDRYMSKAPGSVSDYDGSGDWFKIYDWGPSFSGSSVSWPLRSMFFFLSILIQSLYGKITNPVTNQPTTRTTSPSASLTASTSCASSRWPFITPAARRSGISRVRRFMSLGVGMRLLLRLSRFLGHSSLVIRGIRPM